MLKKVLSISLAALFVALSCAGCGNKEKMQNENGWSKLELTVWETQGTDYAPSAQISNNIVEQWLVDKTNVKVTNIYGNGGTQWDPKLTKLLAGDDLPDIVHCGALQGPAHFARLDEFGKVWELTPEMLQQYAPDLWKKTPAEYWEKMTVNGKILGVPYYSYTSKEINTGISDEAYEFIKNYKETPKNDVTYAPENFLWVRDDILQKVYPEAKTYEELAALLTEKGAPIGEEMLDIPIYSSEDFIQFMYDVKDMGLTENGKTVYAFGYDGSDNWAALCWLGADMYGYKGHYYSGTWNDKTQRIEIPLVKDVIKTAIKTQNQMLADKVIDPESLAQTSAMYTEKAMNGQYAIVPMSSVGISAVQFNKQLADKGVQYRYRPFITQVKSMEEYGPYTEERLWGESLCILNTLSEDELHQVLNWINVQFTDEYEEVFNWGPKEAGLYTDHEDGTRTFKDERFNKYFIEKDSSALTQEETLGLGGAKYTVVGLFSVRPTYYSQYTPDVYNRHIALTPDQGSGFKFMADSEHVKAVKLYPPCQIWSSLYANIPEVVDFWGERDQWENDFKLVFAAEPGAEFEKKWTEAVTGVSEIVDIKKLEDEMTKIAKENLPD